MDYGNKRRNERATNHKRPNWRFERQDRKTTGTGNLLKDNEGLHITLNIKLNKP